MLTVVYTCFVGTVAAKQYSEEVKEAGRVGQAVLGLMRRDLEGAFVFSADSSAMEGQTGSVGSSEAGSVNFVTTSDSRRAVDGKGADYCEVGYLLYPSQERESMLSLYRREDHYVDESPFDGGVLELLDDEVKSLELEYFSEDAWLDSWSGEGLPEAVKITLVLRKDSGKKRDGEPVMRDYTFSTIVVIPAGRGM
jgi:hypothetical protein